MAKGQNKNTRHTFWKAGGFYAASVFTAKALLLPRPMPSTHNISRELLPNHLLHITIVSQRYFSNQSIAALAAFENQGSS